MQNQNRAETFFRHIARPVYTEDNVIYPNKTVERATERTKQVGPVSWQHLRHYTVTDFFLSVYWSVVYTVSFDMMYFPSKLKTEN